MSHREAHFDLVREILLSDWACQLYSKSGEHGLNRAHRVNLYRQASSR